MVPITLVLDPHARTLLHQACTIDVSKFGIRVRVNARLQPGQEVDVIAKTEGRHVFRSRVVWVNPADPQQPAEAGLEFID